MPTFIRRREFLVGSAALLAASGVARASNHRSSPSVQSDIATDLTDVYMFRSPNDASKLVVVMDTHPFSVPVEASNYHYQPSAVYRFFFTTNAMAIPTARIDFVFTPFANGQQKLTGFFPNGIVVEGMVTQGTVTSNKPNPPIINHGPAGSGIAVFAGPRDDPFFFDFVGYERFIAKTGGFTGDDAFAGYNVMSIVAQFPITLVSGGATQFGMWAVTYTDQTRQGDFNPELPPRPPKNINLMQLDRDGNPFVNTVLIPAPLKNAYNFGEPRNDARDFEAVILQSLANFGTNSDNTKTILSVVVPNTMKLNLAEPDGFPNGRLLTDHTQNVLLSLITNGQVTTDGVAGNDVPYLAHFPYLAPPHQAKAKA